MTLNRTALRSASSGAVEEPLDDHNDATRRFKIGSNKIGIRRFKIGER